MMRLSITTAIVVFLTSTTLYGQQSRVPSYAQGGTAKEQTQTRQPIAQAPAAPFQLTPNESALLDQHLRNWETQSKGTKTLECKFKRWHYDPFGAAANVHSNKAEGVIKYAAPDKGLFRVDSLFFFAGMQNQKPQFAARSGQFGEYWVCNGEQLIEYDRSKEQCKIQDLPPNLKGTQIFNSPLPFVFNSDANQIKHRYWVRLVNAGNTGMLWIEAWPKFREDRAQYKFVRIALDAKTYLPRALSMYAPNFDKKKAPIWDHYEFTDVKRNTIGQGLMNNFLGNFLPQKPPANWKIIRERFTPPEMAQGNPRNVQ